MSGIPRAIGTPCDKRCAFDGTLEEVTPEHAPMLTPTRSSRVAGQAVRSRHRSSPRRPVTRSLPLLHAPRSQAPTGHTTQLSSRPARRELENLGSHEPVRAKAAYSRIRALSITRRYRYGDYLRPRAHPAARTPPLSPPRVSVRDPAPGRRRFPFPVPGPVPLLRKDEA